MKRRSFAWLFLLIALALLTFATVRQQEERQLRRRPVERTSFSAKPNGTKALYRTLERLGYRVQRWRRQWRDLNLRQPNTVLFVIEPATWIVSDTRDWRRLLEFAEAGNLIWLSSETTETVAGDELSTEDSKQAKPLYPAAWLKGVRSYIVKSKVRLTKQWAPPVRATFVNLQAHRELPLLGDEIGTALKVIALGKGFIIVDSNPYALSNEGIGKGDHLRLILNVAESMARRSGKVLIDEWGHGFAERGHWWWAVTVETRYVIVQLLVALTVLLVAIGIRFGKPVAIRSQPFGRTAFVLGLASLLGRGNTLPEVVRLLRLHFLCRVLRDPYLWREPDENELQRRLETLSPSERETVLRLWERSEQIRQKRRLKEKEVLAWAKEAAKFIASVQLSAISSQQRQNKR